MISSWPRVILQIAWTAGGNSTAPNHWYTVSSRLRGSWKAELAGRQYELDAVQSGQMSFSLDNVDGAFDPDNTSSFFYPYVVPYRRCRLVLQTSPTRNLLYQGIATGTSTGAVAASTGTIGMTTGLAASPSGLTTALTWAVPNGAASGAAFGLAGATQSWATTASWAVTVTPGAAYSAGVDISLAAGGMSSLGVQQQIAFYDLNGNALTSSSASATVTTSWSRITVSGAAQATAAFAIVSLVTTAATTAATTVQVTGWQLEQAAAPTPWADPGPFTSVWQGFVERWPQKYEQNGKYGVVQVTAVDALAPLSQLTLGYAMPAWVASQITPQYWFDLASTTASPDISGGKAFPDLGGSAAVLDIVGSNIATGTSITSTSSVGTLWNTPGPVITLSNSQASSGGSASGASYLQPRTPSGGTVMLPTSGGWTRMICFRTTVTPGTGGTYSATSLWCAAGPGFYSGTGDKSGVYCFINSTGNVGVNVQNSTGSSLATTNTQQFVCDGNWHCAVVSLSADGKTLTVAVDSYITWHNTATSDMHSTTYDHDAIGTFLADSNVNTQPFAGDLAWVAQWNAELTQSQRGDLCLGFANGWAGDNNGTRLNRVLTLANFHSGAVYNSAYIAAEAILGGTSFQGRSPLDVIQECADTEVGQFTVNRAGVPVLYGQLWRWIQSQPVVTFGEHTAAGEIPYLDDVEFEQDPAHLYNDIQITCDGSVDLTNTNALQEVSDATSQAAYFPQSLQRTITPNFVSNGMAVAQYLLSQYKDPHTRLQGLTIDLAANPSVLTALSTLNFGDMVRVNRRPALAPSKTLDCFLEQVAWSGDDTGANLKLHLQMSPASQYRYGVISAAWATLTAGVAAGVTTVTLGPVSGNAAIAAQYVIPSGTGYQMTLGYGTANAETVTIQSVQAVAVGYSTVQITFTAATTQPHSAGDYLCDINPGNLAIPPVGRYPTCFDGSSQTGGTSPLVSF
nr:LamG domain-containing protein [Streptomyces sp. SID5468]